MLKPAFAGIQDSFFFQAEDGIRDLTVTGVQTCALPIWPHRVRDMEVEVQGVVTNKTPNAPYRGAGRPETVFAMDRAIDRLARELAMDPAELRRRNYLTSADMPYELDIPYRDGNRLVYDSGDFRANLEAALTAI